MNLKESLKYQEISNWIKEKINNGTYVVGSKIPSENELAALFGYSRQTVRQAVGTLESDGYLIRERGSGTFVNKLVKNERTAPTMRIGVVTTYLDDYIFPGIIHGIEEILTENHYSMSLGITHNRQLDEENCLHQMLENGVDGLIVEGTKSALPNINGSLYKEISQLGIPIVFLNGYYRDYCDSYVIMDDVKASALLTELLIHRGHTKIGGIFKSDDIQGLKRYEGMQIAAKSNKLLIPDQSIIWYTTEDFSYWFSGGMDQCILSRLKDVTAIISYNDQTAASFIQLLQRHHLQVPTDYSVVSFDNSLLADSMAYNLTSVIYPSQEVGSTAAKLILQRIAQPKCLKKIILPPSIQERSSVCSMKN